MTKPAPTSDAELFASVTADLAARGLLARCHAIKAGSVEVQLIPADGRTNEDEIERRRNVEHEETMYGSAGN